MFCKIYLPLTTMLILKVYGHNVTNGSTQDIISSASLCRSAVYSENLDSTIECSYRISADEKDYPQCQNWKNNSFMRINWLLEGNKQSLIRHTTLACTSESPMKLKYDYLEDHYGATYPNILQERTSIYNGTNGTSNQNKYKITIRFPDLNDYIERNIWDIRYQKFRKFATKFTVYHVEDPQTETKILINVIQKGILGDHQCRIFELGDRRIEVKDTIITLPCFTFGHRDNPILLQEINQTTYQRIDKPSLSVTYDLIEGFKLNVSTFANANWKFYCQCTERYEQFDSNFFTAYSFQPGTGIPQSQTLFAPNPKYIIPAVLEPQTYHYINTIENITFVKNSKIKMAYSTQNTTSYENWINETNVQQNVAVRKYGIHNRFVAVVELEHLYAMDNNVEWGTWMWWNSSLAFNSSKYANITGILTYVLDRPRNSLLSINGTNTLRKWDIVNIHTYPNTESFLTLKNEIPLAWDESSARFICGQGQDSGLQILECHTALECQTNLKCFRTTLDKLLASGIPCKLSVSTLSGLSCSGDLPNSIPHGYCISTQPLTNGIAQCSSQEFNIKQAFFKGFDGHIYLERDPPKDAILRLTRISTATEDAFYTLLVYTFLCVAHPFFYEHGLHWSITYSNGTIQNPVGSLKILDRMLSYKNIESKMEIIFLDANIVAVNCHAPVVFSKEWHSATFFTEIKSSVPPEILPAQTVLYFNEYNNEQSITCQAIGLPQPSIQWTSVGKDIDNSITILDSVFKKVLHFPFYNDSFAGEYVCSASNVAGNATKRFHVFIVSGSSNKLYYTIAATGFCVFGLLALVVYLLQLRIQKVKKYEELKEIIRTLNGTLENNDGETTDPKELPFDLNYELERHSFSIDKGKLLGQGHYGIVYKGQIVGINEPVAFKTLKSNSPTEQLKALVSELKIIMYIGEHENLVALHGAYRQEIKQGVLYVAIEFCDLGSLETYLKRYKYLYQKCPVLKSYKSNAILERDPSHATEFSQLHSIRSLLKWCYQIANAMDYLGYKNVIHSDLATRNILLTAEGNAKVTDFGLSRRTYNYSEYIKTAKDALPWRWLAIESLVSNSYSAKSDVWAYGITLWEMFSLWELPYPGISPTIEFVQELEKGLRNIKPKYSSSELYRLMIECWHLDPNQRPSFCTLKIIFHEAVTNKLDNVNIEVSDRLDLTNVAVQLPSTSAEYTNINN